jgi:hypothetical protein
VRTEQQLVASLGGGTMMRLLNWILDKKWAVDRRLGRDVGARSIGPFIAPPDSRERLSAQHNSELARLFFRHRGRPMIKWADYLDLYDRYFMAFRGKKVSLLEIGVLDGGSLELWRSYFGPNATIFGLDIDPRCAKYESPPNQIRIGSQDDPEFLNSVVAEMGTVNIVVDDGSHIGRHQKASFRTLFPLLEDGGLYVIEDLHTSYWRTLFEGGYRRRGTGIELMKQLIDDMHAWFHPRGEALASKEQIAAIHFHESIVFIEKGSKQRPVCITVGEQP